MTVVANREALLQTVESQPILLGRFHNVQRLGASAGGGNFSLMFTARDGNTNAQVALKFFNPSSYGDAYRVNSFRREAAILEEFAGQRDIITWVAPVTDIKIPVATQQGIQLEFSFIFYALELASCDVESIILAAELLPKVVDR